MLTKKEILKYHLGGEKNNNRGFELEIFCLGDKYQRLFLEQGRKGKLQNLLNYLREVENFKKLDLKKTIGVEKNGSKFTFEPGFQLEYSTKRNKNADTLIKDFFGLLKLYKSFCKKLGLKLSDVSLFPAGDIKDTFMLATDRYKIMNKYFSKTGTLGSTMMRNTNSLQLTISYGSKQDLEEKVNRLLFLKPVLLALSSNSRVHKNKDTGFRSFRDVIWKNTDPKRCGDPGKNFWINGRWIIEDYIEKVLDAPVIFDVVNKRYKAVPAEPFRNLMDSLDLESYIFHNSTIFTDIRIKDYIELRYLDNPTILLVPGMILLVENALNNGKVWKLLEGLPYKFENVPDMSQKLNTVDKESFEFWNQAIKPVLVEALNEIKLSCSRENHFFLDVLLEKIHQLGSLSNLQVSTKNFLENSTNQFNNNLIRLASRE